MARCFNNFGETYECNSGWYNWGRWVALGVILVLALLFFFLCSCFSARRRRRGGRQPYYGTGWATQTPFGHGAATYNPGYNTQAPPQYGQTTNTYGANQYGQAGGYYGGQREVDTEMQPPQNTYRGGDDVYSPPAGPPPGKKDVVR